MKEIWKEVPSFPGYEVSNLGQVRSYFCRVGKKWEIVESPQRTLRPSLSNKRYQGVNLRRDGKSYRRLLGHLVLLTFVGPPPNGMEMCHNDGDSFNDRLDNLRYDTRSANIQDMFRHGRSPGSRPYLNQKEAHTIRIQFASGKHSRQELAEEHGISHYLIWCVLTGRGAYEGGPGPIQKRTWLTDQQAEAIRRERVSGKSLANLAEKYGISESAISLIASGKRHGNAGGPRVRPWEKYLRANPNLGKRGKSNISISCACGCGETRLKYDPKGRPRRFIQGHNPKHPCCNGSRSGKSIIPVT